MKKGFKKFLGAMAVLSIFGGSVGIGTSALYSSGFGRDLAELAESVREFNDLIRKAAEPVDCFMAPVQYDLIRKAAEVVPVASTTPMHCFKSSIDVSI